MLAIFITFLWCCCISYTINPATDIDGTYDFTALSEAFQINLCTNGAGESYMSINAINPDGLKHADYVFGAFRNLDAPQEPKCGVFVLEFSGFQMVPPPSNDFEAMKYKFTVDTNVNPYKYQLSRNFGAEIFILDKKSMIPLTNCFEPGDHSAITFPIMYESFDLKGSGICPSIGDSCFDVQSKLDAESTDSCWAAIDVNRVAYGGGVFALQSSEWGGNLRLQSGFDVNIPDGGVCAEGSVIVIADPKERGKIIQSWRCQRGHLGYIYELQRLEMDHIKCPLFNP